MPTATGSRLPPGRLTLDLDGEIITSLDQSSPRANPRPGSARDAHLSLYTELAQRVQSEGLLRRRYAYYWLCFAAALVAFAGSWVWVAMLRDSWFQLLPAAVLGVVSAQLGFLGHDAAHRQVFRSARWNEWSARVISGALIGLSYGWWISKHNRHHSGPNQLERDPDIAPGVMAFTPAQARSRRGVAAAFTRRQGWWFFVLLPLEGLNLQAKSVRTLLGAAPVRQRAVEGLLLTLRLAGVPAVLFLLLSPAQAVAFLAVQLGVFGVLLGGAFAPNHIGMPLVPAGARPDFLRRQVLMSRNISGGRLVGFLMGGLNHQIEHHLFPSMPRPGLREARLLVRAYCVERQITYTETTLPQAYRAIVGYLNSVGLHGRDPFVCPMLAQYR